MNKKLTIPQAYRTMQLFLEDHYYRTLSDDLGSLLSGLLFLSDGMPADVAVWEDWIDAADQQQSLTEIEALQAVHKFLKDYYLRGKSSSKDIKTICDSLDKLPDGTFDQTIWQQWIHSIDRALKDPKIEVLQLFSD